MSRVTKIKHVLKEQEADDYEVPKENQRIVRIVASRGNNLHEVETAEDNEESFLVSMPVKFRKNVWVKRGNFVLIEPIEEGNKVKAEICRILTPTHIKIFEKEGVWPRKFSKKRELEENLDEDGLFRNTNRKFVAQSSDDDDDEDEDEDSAIDEDEDDSINDDRCNK
ncbi:probable RNA-binding protein EIF1AD [Anopheles nili]|uniref:probable RNA-binding protein EIF1AD n=1 Tax=Anopheles nili TaxID=185578 RepID=UPI00237BD986|nr:probable RNA-binding protein EIF1AD [Anopheles nili]XP_053673213.1 probable RNA-binding protein EIF1AD [Anopheles nili]XP_053673214.1 probable RNA-binding protein EIF1AD [Anopheles nili]